MRICRSVLEAVAAHARAAQPEECCGILLTRAGGDTVCEAIAAGNIDPGDRRRGYVLDHRAHLRAVDLEASGSHDIVGYYHSHPQGGSAPSERDRAEGLEGITYLIAGLADSEVMYAAWRRKGRDLVAEPVEAVDE